MKHVDPDSLSPGRRRGVSAEKAQIDLFREILSSMEQAVICWDDKGACAFISDKLYDMLEVSEEDLTLGASFKDYIKASLARREISAETAARALDAHRLGQPFRATRTTRSRRRIMIAGRPRTDGGLIVTYTDISDIKKNEAALATAKARAESAEAELSAQLDRITEEKRKIEARHRELERLSLIAAHAKDLIVISSATNQIEWANEAYRRQNGLDLEMDLIGKSARDALVGPETEPEALAAIDDAIRNRHALTIKLRCYRRSGETYVMEQEITPVFNDRGEHTNFIMVGRDVTEKLKAERLAEEARRFEMAKRDESRLLAEFNEWLQSSDSLEELFQVVSSFLEKLMPRSRGAVFVYADSRDLLMPACLWPKGLSLSHLEPPDCWALRRGRGYFFGENAVDFPCIHVRRDCADDAPDRYYCLPIVAHGDTVGLLHILFDEEAGGGQDLQKLANFCAEQISLAIANVRLREQLREQSTQDALTGLFNRRYFLDHAKRALDRCAAAKTPAALLSLDIDHFKGFNDEHGHEAGDTVLRAMAGALRSLFREADAPCRLGGEEFVLLLSGADKDRALERAEALRKAIAATRVRYGGQALKVTVSVGVAAFPDDGLTAEALLQEADRALYAAKAAGRDAVRAA